MSIKNMIDEMCFNPIEEFDCTDISVSLDQVKKSKDSVLKNLTQLRVVAKHPFFVNGVIQQPPVDLYISPLFFQRYNCSLDCGACCADYTIDYLPQEWTEFLEFYDYESKHVITRLMVVNGHEVPIYTFNQSNPKVYWNKTWCQFLDTVTGGCTIHNYNGFSCQVELIKFLEVKNRGYIRKGRYGRGWAMKRVTDNQQEILCTFEDFSEEQFYNNDLPVLYRMKNWADYFGIATYIPEIISITKNVVENKMFPVVEKIPVV